MKLRTISKLLLLISIVLMAFGIIDHLWLSFSVPGLTAITTLCTFAFAVTHGVQRYGWRGLLILLVLVVLISLAFESVGVATGSVYGPYHYTDKLGPKFLNLVPYLIPAAWFMMMYASLVIAESLPGSRTGLAWQKALSTAALGGLVMTAWDVGMDPLMVAGGHWVWEVQGAYFGVPLQNYWGWWLTSFCALLAFLLIVRPRALKTEKAAAPASWAVLAYAAMGCSTVLMDLFTGLGGAGMACLFAMLPWAWMGWLSARSA